MKYSAQGLFFSLAVGASAWVYGADQYYSVNYGVVQAAEAQPTAWYKSKRTGYTVRLSDSARLVRMVSKTDKILVGDCVAIDSNGKEKNIRRVENTKCPAAATASTSVPTQQVQSAGTPAKSNEVAANRETSASKTKENSRSSACDNALRELKNAPVGPKRREARRHAAKVCD